MDLKNLREISGNLQTQVILRAQRVFRSQDRPSDP